MVITSWYTVCSIFSAKHGIFMSAMPCLDLYGRGYSDAPETTYDSTLYTTQLALLMQYLKWDKANIVGLSMGGGIAAAFTSQFPHLVDEGVALIASAGLMEVSAFHLFFLGFWFTNPAHSNWLSVKRAFAHCKIYVIASCANLGCEQTHPCKSLCIVYVILPSSVYLTNRCSMLVIHSAPSQQGRSRENGE